MSQGTQVPFYPTIDEEKIPAEIAVHLRLIYDRLNNHATAVGNVQQQINSINTQVKSKP
jgi:hypothetical protein